MNRAVLKLLAFAIACLVSVGLAWCEDLASQPVVPAGWEDRARQAAEAFAEREFDAAAAIYEAMIAEHPRALLAWGNLGVVRWEQERYDEAEAALRHAVRLSPKDGYSLHQLGYVQFLRGKHDEAEVTLRRAHELDASLPTLEEIKDRQRPQLPRSIEPIEPLDRTG